MSWLIKLMEQRNEKLEEKLKNELKQLRADLLNAIYYGPAKEILKSIDRVLEEFEKKIVEGKQ